MSLDKERAALVDDIIKGAYSLLKENNFNGDMVMDMIKERAETAAADEQARANIITLCSCAIELICKYRKTKTSATAHH